MYNLALTQYKRRTSDMDTVRNETQLFAETTRLLEEIEERSGVDELLKAEIRQLRKKVNCTTRLRQPQVPTLTMQAGHATPIPAQWALPMSHT